jgi:hypothetical protein
MSSTYKPLNGSASVIHGRGLAHRRDNDNVHERAELASDAVCATRPFVPSCGQASQLFHVPLPVLREHIKARKVAETYGNEHSPVVAVKENGNGAAAVVRCEFVHSLVKALQSVTPAERFEVARGLGPDWCWDELILPIVRVERASNT